jgi:hypothetical protein
VLFAEDLVDHLLSLGHVAHGAVDMSARRVQGTKGIDTDTRGDARDEEDFVAEFASKLLVLDDLEAWRASPAPARLVSLWDSA